MARESLFGSLAAAADAAGTRTAFTFLDARLDATSYSFRELFARVERIAAGFDARPVRGPVGILVDSQESQVLHYLAALSRSLTPAILTPYNRKLNREYYVRTMAGVLERCRFGALITDLDGFEGCPVLRPYTLEIAGGGPEIGDSDVQGAAFLQFSSGTTGIKRGVLVTDAAALAQLRTYAAAIDLHADDCIVSWLPLYHDMGFITSLNLPLLFGVHSVMMQPADWVAVPAAYLHAITRHRGTLGWNPNFAYKLMADRVTAGDFEGIELSSLRGLVNCSEPVTAVSQDAFQRRFAGRGLRPDVFWGCYAMAETTFAVTHGVAPDIDDTGTGADLQAPSSQRDGEIDSRRAISVGRALPSVDLRVRGEDGALCADGVVGELIVRSPFNAAGYYNNPEATTAAFEHGWYRTGDLGYCRGDRFFVCGRKKDLLIVGGANLHPNDVEELVSLVDGVQPGRVVVFAEFDAALQTERAVILVELREDAGEERSVVNRIRQHVVAAFQIPAFAVHVVPPRWLVKSSAGKIARRANREKWEAAGVS